MRSKPTPQQPFQFRFHEIFGVHDTVPYRFINIFKKMKDNVP